MSSLPFAFGTPGDPIDQGRMFRTKSTILDCIKSNQLDRLDRVICGCWLVAELRVSSRGSLVRFDRPGMTAWLDGARHPQHLDHGLRVRRSEGRDDRRPSLYSKTA